MVRELRQESLDHYSNLRRIAIFPHSIVDGNPKAFLAAFEASMRSGTDRHVRNLALSSTLPLSSREINSSGGIGFDMRKPWTLSQPRTLRALS